MKLFALITVAGLAAVASAEPTLSAAGIGNPTQVFNASDYFDISTSNTRTGGTVLTITANQNINYTFGFPADVSFLFDIGEAIGNQDDNIPIRVFGLGWETTHTAIAPSWLSEFRATFSDSTGTNGVDLQVSGTQAPGTEGNSSNGIIKLDTLNPPLDFLLPDKLLLLSLWDTFNDFNGQPEGFLHEGSMFFLQVEKIPAPGAMALLGLGGLVATRRRR